MSYLIIPKLINLFPFIISLFYFLLLLNGVFYLDLQVEVIKLVQGNSDYYLFQI